MDTQESFTYSSEAYWRNGGYGPAMSTPRGTLGLTAAGRLIFTLDGGKVLFSAPVALIKRKNEKEYGWMRFVVGPRLYTLQFYQNDRSANLAGAGLVGAAAGLAEPRKGDKLFDEWADRLDEAQAVPADKEQLIAALPTPSTLRARDFGNRTTRQGAFTGFGLFVGLGLLGLLLGLAFARSQAWIAILGLVVAIAGGVFLYQRLRFLNKRRQQVDAEAHAPEDTKTQPSDILPAGTQPTGGFGMTSGKQALLGVALVPAAFIGVFIIAVIVIAIVLAATGNL